MAEHEFPFRVLSPLGTAFEGQARSVTLPTPDGEITILADHMPMVSLLAEGEILIRTAVRDVWVAVSGGFLETGSNAASVLSDFAAESDSIEIARVEAAKARAEQLLAERKERGDLAMVERDLQRAILQLKVAQKIRTRRRQ
ncbi:MAG: ATP synthase F1 subunit epsilon [Spirochaetia bacterium]|jgi:F-type H+-transporting ATPase subunit epsilon